MDEEAACHKRCEEAYTDHHLNRRNVSSAQAVGVSVCVQYLLPFPGDALRLEFLTVETCDGGDAADVGMYEEMELLLRAARGDPTIAHGRQQGCGYEVNSRQHRQLHKRKL